MCKLGQPPAPPASAQSAPRRARNKARHTHNALINYPPKISPLIFYLCWAVCDLINVRCVCLSAWPNGIESSCSRSVFGFAALGRYSALISNSSSTPTEAEFHAYSCSRIEWERYFLRVSTLFKMGNKLFFTFCRVFESMT